MASRLAEYGFQTLLLSSGANDTLNPILRQKSLYNQVFQTSHLKHYLPTNPSRNLNNRTINTIVWNTLGGNRVNGGGVERMMINDWTSFIKATNDPSFDHHQMAKYYQMVENFTSNRPSLISTNHGHHGPIKITQVYEEDVSHLWQNVTKELNETFTYDYSGAIDYGFSFEPSSFSDGLRSWSAETYLTSAMSKYPNLKVITGATAIKLDVDETTKQIQNVLFVSTDGLFRGTARKEYILSAGTFHSPHLLILSGIGDPDILRAHQISHKTCIKTRRKESDGQRSHHYAI